LRGAVSEENLAANPPAVFMREVEVTQMAASQNRYEGAKRKNQWTLNRRTLGPLTVADRKKPDSPEKEPIKKAG